MSVNTRRRVLAAVTGILFAAVIAPAAAQQPGTPTPGGWAIVDSDGTLGANSNVVKVMHVGTGIYRVVFNQDVSQCAGTATIAAHTGRHSVVPGYLVVGRNDNAPTQMRVYTFDSTTLIPADFRFDLLVSC
jgi:hypothetical protein